MHGSPGEQSPSRPGLRVDSKTAATIPPATTAPMPVHSHQRLLDSGAAAWSAGFWRRSRLLPQPPTFRCHSVKVRRPELARLLEVLVKGPLMERSTVQATVQPQPRQRRCSRGRDRRLRARSHLAAQLLHLGNPSLHLTPVFWREVRLALQILAQVGQRRLGSVQVVVAGPEIAREHSMSGYRRSSAGRFGRRLILACFVELLASLALAVSFAVRPAARACPSWIGSERHSAQPIAIPKENLASGAAAIGSPISHRYWRAGVRFGRMSRLLRASWRASHGWWLGYLNRLIGNRRTSQRGRATPLSTLLGSAGAT